MKQTDELLKTRMDPLMRTLETSEPQFYSTYFAAWVIKDLGLESGWSRRRRHRRTREKDGGEKER